MAFENFVGGVDCFGLFPRFALQFGAARKAVWTPGRRHFPPRFFDLRKRGARLQFERLAGVVDFVSHPSFIEFPPHRMSAREFTEIYFNFFCLCVQPEFAGGLPKLPLPAFSLGTSKI